jgi:uncharacterized membrane protein YGL010W
MRRSLQDLYHPELAFYRRYHRNGTNWLIHQFCIPLEWLSWLIFCSEFFEPTPLVVLIALYYCVIATSASYKATCVLLLLSAFARLITSLNNSLIIAVLIQVSSWYVQIIIGHNHYEKNSPGMYEKISLNSIVLSLLMTFESRK